MANQGLAISIVVVMQGRLIASEDLFFYYTVLRPTLGGITHQVVFLLDGAGADFHSERKNRNPGLAIEFIYVLCD